jgi:hypothetical protein
MADHFRCLREDLSADEVITAFKTYLDWQGRGRPPFEYRQVEVRPLWFRLGYRTGTALGKLWRAGNRAFLKFKDETARCPPCLDETHLITTAEDHKRILFPRQRTNDVADRLGRCLYRIPPVWRRQLHTRLSG